MQEFPQLKSAAAWLGGPMACERTGPGGVKPNSGPQRKQLALKPGEYGGSADTPARPSGQLTLTANMGLGFARGERKTGTESTILPRGQARQAKSSTWIPDTCVSA
jgi:hypothetical protein